MYSPLFLFSTLFPFSKVLPLWQAPLLTSIFPLNIPRYTFSQRKRRGYSKAEEAPRWTSYFFLPVSVENLTPFPRGNRSARPFLIYQQPYSRWNGFASLPDCGCDILRVAHRRRCVSTPPTLSKTKRYTKPHRKGVFLKGTAFNIFCKKLMEVRTGFYNIIEV